MRKLTFRELILKNIFRQPRTYLAYFLGSLFSVVIFFTVAMMYFHPLLSEILYDGNTRWTYVTVYLPATILYGASLFIIGGLALIFLMSMFRHFLKERRSSLTMYLVLGMTPKKVWQMLFWENGLIGFTSLGSGLVCGLILSKYLLMISQKVLYLDYNLSFYWPIKAIVLTSGVYLFIFSIISVVSPVVINRENRNLNVIGKKQFYAEPKLNQYLVTLSPTAIFLSFFCLYYLAKVVKVDAITGSFINVSNGVIVVFCFSLLLLIGGLYYFFNQTLIQLLLAIRDSERLLASPFFLTLNSLIYRFKESSALLFLFTLTTLGAIVTVSSTLILAEVELFGTDLTNSLAYTYRAYEIKDEEDYRYHRVNTDFISQTIEEAGFKSRVINLDDNVTLALQSKRHIKGFYDSNIGVGNTTQQLKGPQKLLFLIPVSEYNKMAQFNHSPLLYLEDDHELVILDDKLAQGATHSFQGLVEYLNEDHSIVEEITFRFMPSVYNAGSLFTNVTVVTDNFLEKVKKSQASAIFPEEVEESLETVDSRFNFPFKVIHFREWASAPEVDRKIREFFIQRQDELLAKIEQETDSFDPLNDDYTFFEYSSSYQTLSVEEQEKGTTLLISLLIGSVFLIFSVVIIYFKLFGEIDKEARYYDNLQVMGITSEKRNQLVTIEMAIVFFLPSSLAILIYGGIVMFFQLIYDTSIWFFSLKLAFTFFSVQLLVFFVVRYLYVKQMNYLIEKRDCY